MNSVLVLATFITCRDNAKAIGCSEQIIAEWQKWIDIQARDTRERILMQTNELVSPASSNCSQATDGM